MAPALKAPFAGERIFGGDAAKQRAQDYAAKRKGWDWWELGTREFPFRRYGLDPWGRNPQDGIVYTHIAFRKG